MLVAIDASRTLGSPTRASSRPLADDLSSLSPAGELSIAGEHFADGSGVGLAIAKLIVDAHRGRITATSDGLDQGDHRPDRPAGIGRRVTP